MKIWSRTAAVFGALAIALVLAVPPVATPQEYQPSVGQEGKDVIWVPTPEALVNAMLDMGKVSARDYVVDLGSGDGRIVIAAAKRGARALGVEYNPDMVALSNENARKAGVSDRASFIRADIFETDFTKATVLTMYLLPDLNVKLRPKILDMKPGTRVVSHAFSMEDWEPDQTAEVDERSAFLWIVPAKVAGTWSWPSGSGQAELTLQQKYQKIEGILKMNGKGVPLTNAKLEGDRISFSVVEGNPAARQYSGVVNGDSIRGVVKSANQPEGQWAAARGK
jgi:SAM-dependent methyltransferase